MSGGSTAMYVMAAGAAISAIGSYQQGQAQKKMYEEQAQQSVNEGAYRADAAKAQAEKIRKAGRAQIGETRASLAASGVKVGEGTALELERDISQNVEEDALSALLSGKRSTDAAQQEAKMLNRAGANSAKSGAYSAAGTVLSAAGSIAGGWKTPAKSPAGLAGSGTGRGGE